MDTHRFVSVLKRQQKKVKHAKSLLPAFEKCGLNLTRFAALRERAQWLEENGAKPSIEGRGQWTAQTVTEFLWLDGAEPTPNAIQGRRRRNEGMRITIMRQFAQVEGRLDEPPHFVLLESGKRANIGGYGEGARAHFENEVRKHCDELVDVGQKIRTAFNILWDSDGVRLNQRYGT